MVVVLFGATVLSAQNNAHKDLRKADKAYQDKNYPDAEVSYRRALEKDNSTQGNYNLGNSTYRQERFDEAVKHYQSAAENAKDRPTKAQAYHNLGNAHFQKGEYKESVEAYKNALRQNPNDFDTKRNLANALRRLPPPPQQQQNQQGSGEQSKDKEQQKDQNEQEPPQNQDEQPPQNQQPSGGQPKEQPQDLSKEEARQLLEIMDQEEQKVQQKLKKAQARNKKSSKDW